jgi:hypothetical protein
MGWRLTAKRHWDETRVHTTFQELNENTKSIVIVNLENIVMVRCVVQGQFPANERWVTQRTAQMGHSNHRSKESCHVPLPAVGKLYHVTWL